MYTPSETDAKKIEANFTYHAPLGNQLRRYEAIRRKAKELAQMPTEMCPASRELSLALTHLEECVMWSNASIARNEMSAREAFEDRAEGR